MQELAKTFEDWNKDKQSLFDNLLNYKEAARFLGVSESYLRRLKSQGHVPWVKVGSRGVRFRLSSLRYWTKEREFQ